MFQFVQNFLLHGIRVQQAHDDVHGRFAGKQGNDARRVVGFDFGQNDGDGLRIFVFQIVGQNLFVDVAELVPHRFTGGTADFFHDAGDAVFRQSLGQKAFGAFIVADDLARIGDFVDEVQIQLLDLLG